MPATSALAPDEARRLVGTRIEGDTKVTERTMLRLARIALGQPITHAMLPAVNAWLLSSQLFKTVAVRLEAIDSGGYLLVATLDDKLSWVVAPTLYLLPSSWSVGVGYAENNLFGDEKKLLLYGQVGNQTSLFFGTYLDPAVRGSKLMLRFDLYLLHRDIIEWVNPASDKTSTEIGRSTKWNFLDAGALVGWRFRQWLTSDVRLKPAYAFFRDVRSDDPTLREAPERDGWDVSAQARLTIDRRRNRYGVTWGSYLQLITDLAIPGIDDYGYQIVAARAYHSWKFFEEHQLELRVAGGIGRHLPFHEEFTLGGVGDLRGYNTDQFRGDRRATARAEYSVPLFKWWQLAFRALTFFDAGYVGFHWRDTQTRRYLPTQHDGASWTRSDVGGGLRVYVGNVVLPLLGLDVGYGLEGKRYEVYFEVGLTDF